MNIQQLRAVLEIRRTGSVTQAANQLGVSQPNLSRSVKELEHELGITLFRRGAKGMEPTVESAQVLRYAQSIVNQMDELENLYSGLPESLHFCLAAPHASYITKGFSAFLSAQSRKLDITYLQVSAQMAMKSLNRGEAQLAIVRYQNIYDEYFKALFAQSGFSWCSLLQFEPVVLMSRRHPLAKEKSLVPSQLKEYPQLMRGDIQLPVDKDGEVRKDGMAYSGSRVYVEDCFNQFLMLRELQGSYMWSVPLPLSELSQNELVQMKCSGGLNQDIALWRSRPGLGPTGRDCLKSIKAAARRVSFNML